ncbi:hypothetical protein J6590_029442 [Homalodisca vitripennis]|nr:hypothetical protein J6590_029442 [Homalodisca vitripennis]
MNSLDYIGESQRQLNDTSTYEKLDEDPSPQHNEQIQNYLMNNGLQEGLSQKVIECFTLYRKHISLPDNLLAGLSSPAMDALRKGYLLMLTTSFSRL